MAGNTTSTEILLRVVADSAALKKLTDDLRSTGASVKGVTTEGEKLGGVLSASNFKAAAGFIGITSAAYGAAEAVKAFFKESVLEGVKFNAALEQTRNALAGVFVNAGFVTDFNSGLAKSDLAFAELRKKAQALNMDFESLAETFKTNAGSMFNAGVTSLKKQVDLTVTLTQAARAMGVTGFTAVRDIQDILIGMSQRTKLGRELGLNDEELRQAAKAGTIYELLTEKLKGFDMAAAASAGTVQGLQTALHNSIQLEAAAATEDLTNAYKDLLKSMNGLVQSDGFKGVMALLSSMSSEAVKAAAGLATMFHDTPSGKGAAAGVYSDISNAKTKEEMAAAHRQAKAQLAALALEEKAAAEFEKTHPTAFVGGVGGPAYGRTGLEAIEAAERVQRRANLQRAIDTSAPHSITGAITIQQNAATAAQAEADAARAKHTAELKHSVEYMTAYVKESKKASEETERQANLIRATSGNSDDILNALKENEASVRRQFDLERAKANISAPEITRKQFLAKVDQDQAEEMAKIDKARIAVAIKLNAEEFALYQQRAQRGTLSEQIASEAALADRISLDLTKDKLAAQREIEAIQYRIADLLAKQKATEMRDAADLRKNQMAANIGSIQKNPYLTNVQRNAQLNAAYRSEQGELPGQIGALESYAATRRPGSSDHTEAMTQVRGLRGRRETIGNDISATDPRTIKKDLMVGLVDMQNGFRTVGTTIADTIGEAFSGIKSHLTGLLSMTEDWNIALLGIGQTMVTSLVGAIVDVSMNWVARKLIEFTVGKSLAAASLAMNTAQAAALSVLWTPPATLATIATFGGAAAAAPFEMSTAILTAQLSSIIPGLSDGGYTGPGGKNEPAGIVHKGKIVFSRANVARLGGVDAVERLRVNGGSGLRGAGLAMSGAANGGVGPAMAGAGGAGVNIYQAYYNSKQDAETWLRSQSGRRIMTDWLRQQSYDL